MTHRATSALLLLILALGCTRDGAPDAPVTGPDTLPAVESISTKDQANLWLVRAQKIRVAARDSVARLHVEAPETFGPDFVDGFNVLDTVFTDAYRVARDHVDTWDDETVALWRARAKWVLEALRDIWDYWHRKAVGDGR